MKKLIYCAAALVTALFAGSCQRELLDPAQDGSTVTYTVNVPEVATKAIGDGSMVDQLVYAVYRIKANGTNEETAKENIAKPDVCQFVYQKTLDVAGKTRAIVPLELINNQRYIVLFWAQNTDAWFDDATHNLGSSNIAYPSDYQPNNDKYDAFTNVDYIEVNGAASKNITLTRPFGQLNIATNLPSTFDAEVNKTTVSVMGLAHSYNVATKKGTVTVDPLAPVAFVEAEPLMHDAQNYLPFGNYARYISMNYVFVEDEQANVAVTYDIETTHGKVSNTINSVPVKKNYKTNIVGNLLTSNVDYNVTLDKEWGTPDTEEYVWNGTEILQPAYNAETNTYTIKNAAELAWIANEVNVNNKTFSEETVQLVADIDLRNHPWTPIGHSTTVTFRGMFEGAAVTKAATEYPTISNLKIENGSISGFFGLMCNGGKVRNINFNNVTISGERQLGVVAGQVYGNLEQPTIENVTVENAVITAVPALDGAVYDNGDKVGGIAGLIGQEAYIKGCTVKNSTFTGYRDMGGIVGSTQNGHAAKLIGNKVENLTFIVTGFYTPYKDDAASGHYAPIRGGRRSNASDVIEYNTGDNIELHKVLVEAKEGAVYDSVKKVYTVTSPAGLAAALQASGAAGAGNHTIRINGDLDMTGMEWTPIYVDGYKGAGIVTVEGNGATIKGLDGALFAGGFAGGSGIVIKDLTIEDAHMIADNTQGYGAFVNCADSMVEITLINCHLENSTIITPNDGAAESRIGGLVGWTAGYNNPNDGPVDSRITIQNCSVTGCTLKGAGSIGGICGHAGANAATFTTIENCTVTGNTLVSTDDGDWRVGAIVGTANNGECVINNVTVSGNTISQVGKTAEVYQSELYGRFVPAGTAGTLTINGTAVSTTTPVLVNGYTELYTADGEYFIYNLDGLKDFHAYLNANKGRHPYDRVYNIMNDINADGWDWSAINVLNDSSTSKGLVLDGRGHTISNLDIIGEGMLTSASAGSVIKNIRMDRATVNSTGHNAAIFWGSVYSSVTFENVHVTNSTINGLCNAGAFVGGTYEPNNLLVTFKNCSVENSAVKAVGYGSQDPTGASGFLGKAYGSTKVVFEGTNSIDNATTLTNENGLVGGGVYAYTTWGDGGFVGTGTCDTFTNWNGLAAANNVTTLQDALKGQQAVVLTENVTVTDAWDARYTGGKTTYPVVIDGNGKTLKLTGEVFDKNHNAVFRFENDATVKNLTIDLSEAANTGQMRAISAKGNLVVEECVFIGNPNNTKSRAIIYGEGQQQAQYDAEVSISGCEFINWTRGLTDNENAKDVRKVTVTGNVFNNAHAYMSAYESVTFTGNTMNNSCVNIKSYSAPDSVVITVNGNDLDENQDNKY